MALRKLMVLSDSTNKKAINTFGSMVLNPKTDKNFETRLSKLDDKSALILFTKYLTMPSLNKFVDYLIRSQSDLMGRKKKPSLLIAGEELSFALGEVLHDVFNKVAPVGTTHLPEKELIEAIEADNRSELAIGAIVDSKLKIVVFTRGDFSSLAVPFKYFKEIGSKINPDELKLIDYGQTIVFDGFEISFDSILYDLDLNYRKQLIKKRRAEDVSFGACLRRFRLSKKIKQTDFHSVNEREIGRIERGEVEKPQAKTKKEILAFLGISEDELMTY